MHLVFDFHDPMTPLTPEGHCSSKIRLVRLLCDVTEATANLPAALVVAEAIGCWLVVVAQPASECAALARVLSDVGFVAIATYTPAP